ncbi:MAG: hypothetical protein ABIH19_05015 [Candidatus Omnitrophota bacterium]
MDREEAINDLLKSLRIAFTNASAYNKDHPYFKKTVISFKQKVDTLLIFLNPIQIGISPDSLFVGEESWGKNTLYIELASMLHLRKIKSFEIRNGVSVEELLNFLSSLSKSTREILRHGGIENIFDKESNPHISIVQLDYSQFLEDSGEEAKDIWVYLFKKAVDKGNDQQIIEFADNFENIVNKFKAKDLFTDQEFSNSIYSFIEYLKDKKKGKFKVCTKDLLKFILKSKEIPENHQIDKIKGYAKDLNNDDLAQVLLEGILEKEKFDGSSFKLFSQIVNIDSHKDVAFALESKVKDSYILKNNPKVKKNIKEIFAPSQGSEISVFYRNALDALIKGDALGGTFIFDQELAEKNYYYILLNLFMENNSHEENDLITQHLFKQCQRLANADRITDITILLDTIDKKRKEDVSACGVAEDLEKRVFDLIEDKIFQETDNTELGHILERINESSKGLDYYLKKIFDEGRVTPYALRLLLRFFAGELPKIYARLERKRTDINFLVKFMKGLEKVDSPISMDILKQIFITSNNVIKIQILRSMKEQATKDDKFFFSLLDNKEVFLRKEAFTILKDEQTSRVIALRKLLDISSPLGIRNKLIIENMAIVELSCLEDAEGQLVNLSKRRFLWNRNVRRRAKEILEKRYVGKD